MSDVTQELLREYFDYDGENLRWRTKRCHANVGDVAGGIHKATGYRRINIRGKLYLCHRLIWMYVYGDWPDGMLDHINRDKQDNRIENLRPADMALNVRNRGSYPSKLGVKGVYPCRDKYRSSIQVGDNQIHLGVFDTIDEAKRARKGAEARYWT